MDISLRDQLLKKVGQLSLEDQQRVLDFAKSLSKLQTPANPSKQFVELIGTLDSQSAEEMDQAVEDADVRIDPNG